MPGMLDGRKVILEMLDGRTDILDSSIMSSWSSCVKLLKEIKTSSTESMILFEPHHERNCFMPNANNKGADQPAHPRSLISTFVVCCWDSNCYTQFHELLASVAEQVDLSFTWSKTPIDKFSHGEAHFRSTFFACLDNTGVQLSITMYLSMLTLALSLAFEFITC